MKLINGRGRLGEELKKYNNNSKTIVYHTWNMIDKSEEAQKKCYLDFVDFVNKNKSEKIIFISTDEISDKPYSYYKHKSEEYLIEHNKKGIVMRFPIFTGNGMFYTIFVKICKILLQLSKIRIISPKNAAKQIVSKL